MTDALARGWTDLHERRWEAAQANFEAAAARAQTAEALEGLSWAAWWRDDAEALFAARERAFALYKERGDMPGAARMAMWLAADELDFHGALSVSSGWLARARRLLEAVEERPEHGWLAFHEGYVARVRGDNAAAAEGAAIAARIGRRYGVADLEMLGLALEGSTLVACAEVEAGMRCLDEATAAALEGEAAIPMANAWTFCFLVTACTAVLDYGRAAEWCARIAEFAGRFGSRYMLAYCRAEYGAVDLFQGRWAQAEELLETAVEDFTRSRPGMVGGPLTALAELRRRQGRTADATALLDRAGASRAAQLCRARIALDARDARTGTELIERALRQAGDDALLDRAPALELLVHARVAAGEPDAAGDALAALRDVERRTGTSALRACADRAEGALAAAAGDHDRARRLLEDAVDRFAGAGATYELAHTRLELAATLAELGRGDAAEREASVALRTLDQLGADGDAGRARRRLGATSDAEAALPELTPREREVLLVLAEGLTNHQIAERLVLSEHTVHRHVTNILRKLDLPSRSAAAARAVQAGLLPGRDDERVRR
ncbi:MAG TPA: LuxR C-terminal-related transcriptional regulator [Solirubrobacteraceae bacterium]|nr:LuxR C-terminal-related transcriptional regulator [Solirubrobacteraceae bacterium]